MNHFARDLGLKSVEDAVRAVESGQLVAVDVGAIDGRPRRIWTIFVGNCAYDPPGFAPATRVRLDDGVFDVRIIDGSEPWARVRLIVAALTGNLARSKVHTRRLVSSMTLRSSSDDNLLAADGEIFRGRAGFTVEKHPQRLLVYAPK